MRGEGLIMGAILVLVGIILGAAAVVFYIEGGFWYRG
jgi:hypothetical protein